MTGANPAYDRRKERESLLQQLRLLKDGTMTTRDRRAGQAEADTTQRSIARIEESIAELDGILARGGQG